MYLIFSILMCFWFMVFYCAFIRPKRLKVRSRRLGDVVKWVYSENPRMRLYGVIMEYSPKTGNYVIYYMNEFPKTPTHVEYAHALILEEGTFWKPSSVKEFEAYRNWRLAGGLGDPPK